MNRFFFFFFFCFIQDVVARRYSKRWESSELVVDVAGVSDEVRALTERP